MIFKKIDPLTLSPEGQFQYWRKRFTVGAGASATVLALSLVFTSAAYDARDRALAHDITLESAANRVINITRAGGAALSALSLMLTFGYRRKMMDAWRNLPH
jgi:hypothetical protein